jgi:hypothetical protein
VSTTALQWALTILTDDGVAFEGNTEDDFSVQLSGTMVVDSNIRSTTGQPVEIGFVLIASQAYFKRIKEIHQTSFLQVRFSLVNLELPPTPPIVYSDPDGNTHTNSVIKIVEEGTPFYLEANPGSSAVLKELQYTKGIAVTATAFTFCTNREELSSINSVLSALNIVLTFMQGTYINRLGCDVVTAHGVVAESYWNDAVTRPYSSSTLVNRLLASTMKLRLGSQLWAQCVQKMFTEYRAKNDSWNLSELISAYIDATSEGDYLELRGLKICGCIEILRARFLALKNQTYLISSAEFEAVFPELRTKVTEVLRELLPDASQDTLQAMSGHFRGLNYSPFRRALRQYCKEMTYQVTRPTNKETRLATDAALSAFISTRNALVHYGRFAVPDEPNGDWAEERIRSARCRQYQFVERLAAGMLASLMGWMQIKPETQMPEAPDFLQ